MSNETILVVDDNRRISDFLANTLLPSLGYKAAVAYDGKSGMQLLHTRQFSLLLLDLQLPDTTGLAMLRDLEREGLKVPTILTTAHGSEQVAVDAFRLGVTDYLIKPVDPDSLNAAITRALAVSRLNHEKSKLTTQLKEQVSWLTVLYTVGQSVTSTLEVDEVLRRIVEAGVRLTRAEEGFLALLDEDSSQLYLRAVKNIDEERSKSLRLPVTDALVGRVFSTGRSLRMNRTSDTYLKVSTGFLVNSLIYVPLTARGKTLGVLAVDNRTHHRDFTGIEEGLLTSLADYAAVAIENANLYQQAQAELTERKRVEVALRESEERYALAVQGANDGIWDWDLKNNQVYFSPRWISMLGYREDEISASLEEWFKRIHPEDLERTKLDISQHINGLTSNFENEHRMRHKDGAYHWMLTRGLAVWDKDGIANRIAGSQSDITDRKFAEEKLLHDAFYDGLTGLPNRALFLDRLKHAIERTKRHKEYRFGVLFLDLDRFKDVNDSLGHMLGDQLLIATSQLLQGGLRSTDTASRFGGDEFVILLEEISDLGAAVRVATWIQESLAAPFNLKEHEVYITTSIGIVIGSAVYQKPEDILRDADIAMYVAKSRGKARYEIFNAAMRERIMERLTLENDLRLAIERHEFEVYYQPIVSLQTGQLIGFEALSRWRHPERGLLPPAEFIPIAEETGMIMPIDRWVLRQACTQMRIWQENIPFFPSLTISVNMSGKQIAQPDLIEQISQGLAESGLDAHCLKIEITESTIMENNVATADVFFRLKNMGVEVQIDDFGTGYSSLGYLHQFPVNALKIDRSFINLLDSASSNPEIAQTVVTLAHELGMAAVAEGVETESQLRQLRDLGCEFGQGFLLSVPLTSLLVTEMLTQIHDGKNPFEVIKAKTGSLSQAALLSHTGALGLGG